MTHVASHLRLTLQAEQHPLPADRLRARIEEFLARNSWTRAEAVSFQNERLTAVLDRAVLQSPYYARVIGPLIATGAQLHELPLLTKSKCMEHFDDIVTDRRLSRKLIENHIDGPEAGLPLLGEYRAAATGGTSGERGVFVYSDEAWLSVMGVIGRSQRNLGITPAMRSLGIGAPSPIHLSNRFYLEGRAGRPGCPRLDLTMPLHEIVAALNSYQPEAITTYPSFIRVLAREQQEGRLRIAPHVLRSGAEMLLPEVDRLAQETWGVPVYNGYASTEAGVMASQCKHRNGLHVAEDHLVFEVLDGDGRPVPPGTEGAMCAITTLNNDVLPLIRYVLNDQVVVTEEPCACGAPFIRIASIKGRREETLSFPTRGGETVSLRAIVFRSPLIAMEGVKQFQLAQGDGTLTVRVVPEGNRTESLLRSRVEATLQGIFAEHDIAPPTISVEIVTEIARTGSAAKAKDVVRSG
jgi:phenylacetate-CoA ligase